MNVPLIHPKLYLGSLEDARRLRHLEGWCTVCIAGESTMARAQPDYGVLMDDTEEMSAGTFWRAMRLAVACIDEALQLHPRVLVHCYAGINRSVSALVAYALARGPYRCVVRALCMRSADDVIKYLRTLNKAKRGVDALTNRTFASLLREKKMVSS